MSQILTFESQCYDSDLYTYTLVVASLMYFISTVGRCVNSIHNEAGRKNVYYSFTVHTRKWLFSL